jgi:signal transduction histidine kinase
VRARLTLAFVCLALVIAGVVGSARSAAIADMARAGQLDQLSSTARVIATLVEDLEANGSPITSERLAAFVPAGVQLTVARPGSGVVTVPGAGFDADVGDGATRVRETVGSTTVGLVQGEDVVADLVRPEQRELLALMVLMVMFAALAGFVVASALARPLQQLARASADLGRGRYDIEPPRSRIPEVASIAASLKAGAAQLQDSIRRDREFVHHTSHVLRTPLTGMRLELEELNLRTDLDDEVRRTTTRCLLDVQRLDSTVTELLDFARGRQVVAGAEVTLVTIGHHIAQRWRDRLPESREIKAFVDSGPEVTLTPGPVEQLLDSVLLDVSERGTGSVTLRFAGLEQHVRILVQGGPSRSGAGAWTDSEDARTQVEVLGGRCSGDAAKGELEILLPRR